MLKKCCKKSSIVLVIIIAVLFAVPIHAGYISSFTCDATTGWNKFDGECHMGMKSTTFKYDSTGIKSKYSSYMDNGKAMWGSEISCLEDPFSTIGLVTASALDNDANAIARVVYDTGTKHVTSWSITIYSNNFDDNATSGKYRTMAHEIGHVYGLQHVDNSAQIMYGTYSSSKSVTENDKIGMRVMTHTHTHDSSYSKSYEVYSSHSHKVRCNTCKAYYIDTCTYTSYHSGSVHYYVFNCQCGNNETLSWSCSGNPCVTPFNYDIPTVTE